MNIERHQYIGIGKVHFVSQFREADTPNNTII